jgi:hypoxanthine phosphoribosyltransferase
MIERLEAENPDFEILFNEEQIKERVSEIAQQITDDYKDDPDTPLVLIGVLKGATPFFIDLFRSVEHPNLMMDFVGTSSYGEGEESSRDPKITHKNSIDLEGKNALIVEDIIDTANSMYKVIHELVLPQKPKSVRLCSFLSKPSRREVDVPIDYLGFEIENVFVLGYGLDSNERGRNWPYIAYKKKF